jgi:hypothetical protein
MLVRGDLPVGVVVNVEGGFAWVGCEAGAFGRKRPTCYGKQSLHASFPLHNTVICVRIFSHIYNSILYISHSILCYYMLLHIYQPYGMAASSAASMHSFPVVMSVSG